MKGCMMYGVINALI